MKASELRLGNHIQTNDNKAIVVTGQVIYEGVDGYFKGIPLTEEWLVKFGFEKHGENYNLECDIFSLQYDWNKVFWIFPSEGMINVPVDFVHQLQNLYFALTGEELTMRK